MRNRLVWMHCGWRLDSKTEAAAIMMKRFNIVAGEIRSSPFSCVRKLRLNLQI